MTNAITEILTKIIDSREVLDLQAQMDMAFWAKWMFFATIGGMLISAVAVYAAYRSLKASQQALRLSRETATDSRKIGEFQTQAYVHAAGAAFGAFSNIIVTVKNGGSTPATHFCVNATAKIVPRGMISKSVSFNNDDFKIWSALGASDHLTVSVLDGHPAVKQFYDLPPEGTVLLISGQIIYCTVFNHDHVTQFAFYVDATNLDRFRRPTANLVTFHRLEDGSALKLVTEVPVILDEND